MLFAGLLIGCHSSNLPKSNSIRINIAEDPVSIDPRKARDVNSIVVTKMLFDGLTRLNCDGEPSLAMAEQIEFSPSMMHVKIVLRDAFWSNGDPVRAQDFALAWKKCLDPSFCSVMAFQLYVIKNAQKAKEGKISLDEVGIFTDGDKILEIDLEHPTPYLLTLFASPLFFPVHPSMDETMIGNGPFLLDAWKHQECISLVKNPLYWDAKSVHIEALDLVMVSENTESMLFEKGELDWMGSPLSVIALEALASVKKEADFHCKEMLGTYFLRVNTENRLLSDSRIRRALSSAINRQALVDHVLQGNQIPAKTLVPPSLGLSTVIPIDQDLKDLDFTQEDFCSISILYRTAERSHLVAQAIQDQVFRKLGIQLQLEAVEQKVYFDRMASKQYTISLASWIADFEDPINFLEAFKYPYSATNNTGWSNAQFTELLDQSLDVTDPIHRLQLLSQSEAILLEEMPIIPVFHYTMLYRSRPDLKNVVLSRMGHLDFKWAEL